MYIFATCDAVQAWIFGRFGLSTNTGAGEKKKSIDFCKFKQKLKLVFYSRFLDCHLSV